jgi:hypothetical protein
MNYSIWGKITFMVHIRVILEHLPGAAKEMIKKNHTQPVLKTVITQSVLVIWFLAEACLFFHTVLKTVGYLVSGYQGFVPENKVTSV